MIGSILWSIVVTVVVLANVACVCGGLLGAVMIAQFLEHGVLLAVQRHKLHKSKSVSELRILFYRVYWSLTLLYIAATALWVYLSDRSASKLLYGVAFLFCLQLSQLALAVTLGSWEDVLARVKALGCHPLVQSLQSRVRRFSTSASS